MKRTDEIRRHVTDMYATENHILRVVEQQLRDEHVGDEPRCRRLLESLAGTLRRHLADLDALAAAYDGQAQTGLKRAVTGVTGLLTGWYDRVRREPLTRMLRDDAAALSLCTMAYTTLHTFGLAIQEPRIAELGLRHLADLTPLLMEVSRVLPVVAAMEVADSLSATVDPAIAEEAVRNTQETWARPESRV